MSTTAKERDEVMARLARIGIAHEDARALRRISMTLRRWFELECGDGQGHIERDETTGKPRYHRDNHSYLDPHDPRAWSCIADRETGARLRLAKIMTHYPNLIPYIQTDPRGCALYLLTKEQAGTDAIDSIYSRGAAIY